MLTQKRSRAAALLLAIVMVMLPLPALAGSSSSTNYQVTETYFGAGGAVNSCSTTYCSNASLGELTVGNPSSTHYQVHSGSVTTSQPYLYFTVTSSSTNLGYLSSSSAATTTGAFSVRTYQAGGYVVTTTSPPPVSTEGHSLSVPATPTASAVGTEQFGMNLVANTSPTTFGANPVDNPASGPSVGIAATNYNTTNEYMYHQGDIIAQSTTPTDTTGEADYTISYLFNISNTTQSGVYTFDDILVATATY
jgi:hypothetical protein